MINMGIPESLIAQALTRVLIDEYGIGEGEFRRVCRNTIVADPIIQLNDEQPWHNINLEMEP
jgi:hypothetical protein